MGLIEVIQEQVEIRALPRIWKTEHLLANPKIQGQFAEAGVRADPSNRSASPDGASTGVAVKDPGKSPYVRFKPGGKRGMYFCLRRHYLLGRDPAAFEEPFGFDPEQEYFDGSKWDGPHQGGSEPDSQDEPGAAGTDGLGGKAPIGPDRPFEPTPGPTAGLDDSSQRKAEAGAGSEASNGSAPSQDGGSRAGDSDRLFEKILKLVADGLVALPLGLLADLSLQLAKDPKTFELANWGNLLSLAGRLMRAAGKPRDAQLAFDQALRWFNGHPETDRRLILEVAPAFAELGNLRSDSVLEVARGLHGLLCDDLVGGAHLGRDAFEPVVVLYQVSSNPERFLYLACIAHLTGNEGLLSSLSKEMSEAGIDKDLIALAREGKFSIVNGRARRVEAPQDAHLVRFEPEKDVSRQHALWQPRFESVDFKPLYDALYPSKFDERYECLQELGAGAFGTTVKARHRKSGQIVAVKRLKVTLPTASQITEFEEEARRLSLLGRYGGVVRLLDYGVDDQQLAAPSPYLVMEFMAGGTLRDQIRNRDIDMRKRIGWILQLADALANIHIHPLLHRDLKPENILLSGDCETAKIGDLGIASVVMTLDPRRVPDATFGTTLYMAPEQFPPRCERSQRSEIFSLGLIFFEVLSSVHPFYRPGMSDAEFLAALSGGLSPAVASKLGVPALVQVISRCLQPDPGGRYPSAKELVRGLLTALSEPGDAEGVAASLDHLDDLLLARYSDLVVDKTLVNSVNLGGRAVPSSIHDRLVWRFFGPTGDLRSAAAHDSFLEFVSLRIPSTAEEKGRVKTLLQNQPVKLVDEISVEVDALADEPTASIPLLGIKARIDPEIPLKNPGLYGAGLWVELTVKKDQGAKKSTIRVDEVEPIAPELDPERIASMRKAMTTKEWMAFLLRSIGYNPNVYSSTQQLWLLTRLLPLIEPRVNLIELAPKGTGKTYVFKSVSRHTLVQTAMMSRANLFGDMAGRNPGIFDQHYDCIVQDEIQSARFSDPKEVIGTLKDYLETGSCTVGGKTMTSTTSFVMLGNIPIEHGQPMHPHLFSAQNCLPEPFMETAFLDRFNGILPGWELPKVRSDAKASGLGLQMGVIAQLLHVLRKFDCSEILERYVKPELYPEPNIRDVKSVRRLGSAYLKLLFPHMEVTGEDFVKYCFSPAVQLRARLYRELELRDPGEYKGMTRFTIGEPAKQKAGSV